MRTLSAPGRPRGRGLVQQPNKLQAVASGSMWATQSSARHPQRGGRRAGEEEIRAHSCHEAVLGGGCRNDRALGLLVVGSGMTSTFDG